jgi:hypothetical protein
MRKEKGDFSYRSLLIRFLDAEQGGKELSSGQGNILIGYLPVRKKAGH